MKEIIEKENVANMIYEIRGKEVMLDSDLAILYQVETKRINEAVKNNPDKFPERFSWILSQEELNILRSKFSTANISKMSRSNPRVFTEQGVYMLATILKSKVATKVSIRIMDTFVKMRHYINYNNNLLPNRVLLLENKVDENTRRIDELFDKFNPKEIAYNHIFVDGDFYDSYSALLDIFEKSKEEIIIIDNYAGKELLDILKKINKKTIIVSKNIDDKIMNKYQNQYKNVLFIHNELFHDRFIIIDRIRLFICGSSLKDFGKKCFGISELSDKEYILKILDKVFNKKQS